MYIKTLKIKNFRNYSQETIAFSSGLNIIYGANASGKTNLVESVYFASIGKSPRATKDKEMIKWKEESSYIEITLAKKYRNYNLELYFDNKGVKRISLDKIPITKIADLLGIINISYFSPDELAIIKEGPSERRRFMDIAISQQKKSYFTDLVSYNRIVDQRNKLLKTVRNRDTLISAIKVWDIQLARVGARIINNRYLFLDKLKRIAREEHALLTENQEILDVEYESKVARATPSEMESKFLEQLETNVDKDMQLQYTSIGAHRDDIAITINGIDVRKYGSQGQKRTTALSLKLSELRIIEEEIGEKPILILDDVLSELDEKRQNMLIKRASGIQTLLTCTHFDGDGECKRIFVENGTTREEE